MKKITLTILFALILTSPCFAIQSDVSSTLSDGQRVKVYDKTGSYQGRYERDGNKVKSYGKTGNYQGYSTQSGSKTKYCGKTRNYQGYSKSSK